MRQPIPHPPHLACLGSAAYNHPTMRTRTLSESAALAQTIPQRARRLHSWAYSRAALLCLALALLAPADGHLGPARADFVVRQAVRGQEFRLAAWEVQAIGQKVGDLVARPGAELSPREQHDLVITYFEAIGRVGELDAQIRRIYADPQGPDPAVASAAQQAELDALRTAQEARRPAVEAILEQQIAAVLQKAGLTTAGRVWPPVRFQFTESPSYLIISRRDRIAVEQGVYLDPALSTQEMTRIEAAVTADLDVSALVDGTGGFSSYPTMVVAYPMLEWVLDTITHEWTHTYLFYRPLGWHYYDSGAMRTINETVASIIGAEIGQRALQRFYPERVWPAPWPQPLSMRGDWLGKQAEADTAPGFEFGAFMRETRLETDRRLAAGQIEEAEAYMEARRQALVAQGYAIRKLNQAYFAFHGSYAVGAASTDPLGGKLRALRARVDDLAEFVQTVAQFSTAADLDAALAQ